MRCPECGTDISDPLAAFCPRCAAPLGDRSGEATARLDAPVTDEPATATLSTDAVQDELETSPEPVDLPPQEHHAAPALQRLDEVRERLDRSGWLDALAAAGLGFLVLLAVGAVLVLAAKLNFPQLGGGSDLLSVFNAVVIAALGSLGVPVVIDGIAVWALPLGALFVTGLGLMWAVRAALGDHDFPSVPAALLHGARIGIPFALLCWLFALIFRVRGSHPIVSDAGIALLVGGFWGAVFGGLGALRVTEGLQATAGRISAGLRARERNWFEGASAGLVMVCASAMLSAGAVLVWVIIALAKGAPQGHFGAGDAFAYVVYLAAFLPNIIIAIISLSVGAPIDVGAKIGLNGELVGPLREYSLTAWGRGDPPGVVWLLILIPILACGLGGLYARRRTTDTGTMVPVLLIASGVFAVLITLLGAIGPVRMAGIVKGTGYAFIAPDAFMVFLFAFLVSGIMGSVGWKLAESPRVLSSRFPQTR